MTRIKICGIKDESQALAAAEAGADFIGLVFAPSRRQITPTPAEKIVAALKQHQARAKIVGVFVNASAASVNKIADFCQLDWVQLSGNETWEYCRDITRPVIKTVHVNTGDTAEQISYELSYGTGILEKRKHLFLLDSDAKFSYGGTGVSFNWKLAQAPTGKFQIILAGGLSAENVEEAIRIAAPWGVDVSSAVETEGVKDMAKIRKFIEAVRRADDQNSE
jgi:phosphoribosylanthranilate isomerase